MKIPEPTNSIINLIDQYHESKQEPPRPHLGASLLGHPCDRWLWLSFRWAVQEERTGRILRLLRRGQNEELTIINDLRAIGMDVRSGTNGKQFRVDFGSHISGSVDAIIERGVPEAPKTRHVAEFKTHSLKSFSDLVNNGVEESKPQHWVQMQVYMHGLEIDRALYVAVCKDDDRIYTERVNYNKMAAEKAIERGKRIALSDRMPEPMTGASPSWYLCKFCPAYEFCHETKMTKHANCRTCAHSTSKDDTSWRCERHDADGIPVEFQREGCDSHVLHPDLVPWQRKESQDQWSAVYIINGKDVINGEGDVNVYTSKELIANPEFCLGDDPFIDEMRREFGARVVG